MSVAPLFSDEEIVNGGEAIVAVFIALFCLTKTAGVLFAVEVVVIRVVGVDCIDICVGLFVVVVYEGFDDMIIVVGFVCSILPVLVAAIVAI